MSYDLLDHGQKKLFLDIACFFDRWDKNDIVRVLKDEESAFFPDLQIRKLVDKCLLEIRHDPTVSMHQAIRDMAREIVRQENEEEPGERSRLWDHMDVMHVLRECSGTSSVQSIILNREYKDEDEDEEIQVEALRNMSNLRLILFRDFNKTSWSCSNDNMPPLSFKKLKYLRWWRSPLKCIKIDMPNVVEVRLRESELEILWEGMKSFKKLRILDVSSSDSLTKTANFSEAMNLEELRFCFCENLEELHSSVGCLDKLVILNLNGCEGLLRFPTEVIGKLRSLQELTLTNCANIGLDEGFDPFQYSLKECRITKLYFHNCNILKISDEIRSLTWLEYLDISGNRFPSLPNGLGRLHQLKTMDFSYCDRLQSIAKLPPNITDIKARNCVSLTDLPSNMSELKSLEELDLDNCSKLGSECLLKFIGLTNLKSLTMNNCNVSQVPNKIGNLVSLSELHLSGNTFSSLPDNFSNLWGLQVFVINDCDQLRSLPLLPSNLKVIHAMRCWSLDVMPFASKQRVEIPDCPESICSRSNSGSYEYEFSRNVLQTYKKSSFISRLQIYLSSSGYEVPNWCTYRSRRGDILSFVAPRHLDKKILGLILCSTNGSEEHIKVTYKIINKRKETCHRMEGDYYLGCGSMCVKFYPLDGTTCVVEAGDTVVLECAKLYGLGAKLYGPGFHEEVQRGLCLIYEGGEVDPKLDFENIIQHTRPLSSIN